METNTSTDETKTVSTNDYKSLEQMVTEMELTFNNAAIEGIYEVMLQVGYDREKIGGMQDELNTLKESMLNKTKEDADKNAEQEIFSNKRNAITVVFAKHRSLCRILLLKDVHARVSLQLDGSVPKAYSAWKEMVSNFYTQIINQPALLAKTSTIAIDATVASAQLTALAELEIEKANLTKESAEAQVATHTRDEAFDNIHPQYLEYVKYAKILLAGSPLLKALGL